MSFSQAKHLTHNMRARAAEQGDEKTAEMAQVLHELVEGLEQEHRDIKRTLDEIRDKVRNLH